MSGNDFTQTPVRTDEDGPCGESHYLDPPSRCKFLNDVPQAAAEVYGCVQDGRLAGYLSDRQPSACTESAVLDQLLCDCSKVAAKPGRLHLLQTFLQAFVFPNQVFPRRRSVLLAQVMAPLREQTLSYPNWFLLRNRYGLQPVHLDVGRAEGALPQSPRTLPHWPECGKKPYRIRIGNQDCCPIDSVGEVTTNPQRTAAGLDSGGPVTCGSSFLGRVARWMLDQTVDPASETRMVRLHAAPPSAGLAEWFRHQPSKLITRVRFPWPAPSIAVPASLDRAAGEGRASGAGTAMDGRRVCDAQQRA